jgi:phosphohistidine phosphatase SixA
MNPWVVPNAYLVRCCEAETSADGWGVSLNEVGRHVALTVQHFFAWERLGRVVCSDLTRAVETANYIVDTGNVLLPSLQIDPSLSDTILDYIHEPYQELPTAIVVHGGILADINAPKIPPGGILAVYVDEQGVMTMEQRLGSLCP